MMAVKDILELVQSSKYIIDTDSDCENEINNASPVPTSSEMRNVMKSMLSYLDVHSNVAGDEIWCHDFKPGVRQHAVEISRLKQGHEIQNSAISWKGDIDGMFPQSWTPITGV
ncbi:hypothetical protein TNCV_3265711 [Trichonephila clavipes]|nr:hypothetical protein TNCV_3265711 [Trichonephila clavipes]